MNAQSESDAVGNDAPAWRAMTPLTRISTIVVWTVFVLYLIFLLKLLLLSRTPGSARSLNLVPFAGISGYVFSDSAAVKRFAMGNLIGNVVAFVPLGAFLPLLRRRHGLRTNLLTVVCASVTVEIGGLVGILFFTLLHVLLRSWSRVAMVMAALSLLAVPILYYFLFAIRLRM